MGAAGGVPIRSWGQEWQHVARALSGILGDVFWAPFSPNQGFGAASSGVMRCGESSGCPLLIYSTGAWPLLIVDTSCYTQRQ